LLNKKLISNFSAKTWRENLRFAQRAFSAWQRAFSASPGQFGSSMTAIRQIRRRLGSCCSYAQTDHRPLS
jgi:hypothetical protein